jgi:hypothetical protein
MRNQLLISWFRAGAITKFGMENLCVSSVLTTLALDAVLIQSRRIIVNRFVNKLEYDEFRIDYLCHT